MSYRAIELMFSMAGTILSKKSSDWNLKSQHFLSSRQTLWGQKYSTKQRELISVRRKAREYVGETKDKVVFDLYSGTGTIAQMLAAVAKKVIGVEIVEEAVEAAKQNAALNGLENCEFIAGDVLKVIDEIEEKPDLIVLDPPRDGIHPKALEKIIDFGVDKLVYISCKPTSLARDLVILQERGYKVDRVCAIDQFPMTVHVETVVGLHRKDM